MGLLVSDLEGLVLQEVVPIGSGGDYLAEWPRTGEPVQVEVSGIARGHPSKSNAVLEKKRKQVVPKGFASVTTFYQIRGKEGIAHSFLHYVESTESGSVRP